MRVREEDDLPVMTVFAVLVVLAALLLFAASCGGALSGGTINVFEKPPVTQPVYSFGIVACSTPVASTEPCPWPIENAMVFVNSANGYIQKRTNADGYMLAVATLPFIDIKITAEGFEDFAVGPLEPPKLDHQNRTFSLTRTVPPQALLDKRDFIEHYQGNFGSIPVDACWTFGGTLFDPVDLLVAWQTDRGCFESLIKQHLDRGDNRVVIDPRADYHGQGGFADLWHDPQLFRQYVLDVRAHRNNRGEPLKVLLFFAADGHIPTFLKGAEGVPDREAEAHFERDVQGLAAATRDLVDGTATCWECRHQRDYITPGAYQRIGKIVSREFPQAWHGQHLVSGSSSWASWNCDPAAPDAASQTPPCTEANAHMEGDDPYRGNELAPWVLCVRDGWCDGILYQFHVGDEYLRPDAYPNYTGQPGALGRFFEVAVRMGRDQWSQASKRSTDPRWPLNGGVDVLAFENIYDAYNGRSTEAYGIAFCKRALAIGGWGCGSASWRRP